MPHMRTDPELAAAFGRRVLEIRLRRGLTQEALAELADVHPTFVSNIERGYRGPTLRTIVRLARALEVTEGELVDGLGH
jgi:transcriptional regulator with XRE-family HTH domain